MTGVSVNRVEMWRIWQASRPVVVAALVVTALCGWGILLWHHPGWIIGFGTLLGLVLGTVLGGMDILSGSEEFALSLPTTRARRYLLRAGFGGGVVLALTTLSTLAIGLDLPQRLWELGFESGFTEPFGPWNYKFQYPLAVTVPLLAFVATFVTASLARWHAVAAMAWLPGGLITGAVVIGSIGLEGRFWDFTVGAPNGYLCVPAAAAAAVLMLAGGLPLYGRKEGISRERAGWNAGTTAAVVVGIAVLALFLLLSASVPDIEKRPPSMQSPAMSTEAPGTNPATAPGSSPEKEGE